MLRNILFAIRDDVAGAAALVVHAAAGADGDRRDGRQQDGPSAATGRREHPPHLASRQRRQVGPLPAVQEGGL